jgi:hypothetical protein
MGLTCVLTFRLNPVQKGAHLQAVEVAPSAEQAELRDGKI